MTPANATSTLRTTVPIALVRMLGLKKGGILEWDVEIKNNQMNIIIKPLKKEEIIKQGDSINIDTE